MKRNVIFEIKYPPIDYVNEHQYDTENDEDDDNKLVSDSPMKGTRVNTEYIPIPQRLERSEEFIEEAIRVSKLYHADIRIIESDEKISVYLSFDFCVEMKYASHLLGMTDKISFFKDSSDHDVAVYLDYYTHVVQRNGLAVAP